jgi:vacuolar protein sorting-associated protein 29
MGQLALVLGDFHIPQRCSEIPSKYKDMITPNKVNSVFCTGNLGSKEVYEWIKTLSNHNHIVKGDYEDEAFTDLVEEKVISK